MIAWGVVGTLLLLLPTVAAWFLSKQFDGTLFVLADVVLVPEIIASLILVGNSFRVEYLHFANNTLTIGTSLSGIRREKTYALNRIQNIRLLPSPTREKGTLCFDYSSPTRDLRLHYRFEDQERTIITFGKGLSQTEAHSLVKHLTDIVKFRCHLVEIFMFGRFQVSANHVYLQNPDVSELTVPFGRLRQIVIHTETDDFHLVEQFLTYAINYLGQDYLKQYVDVHVYGEVENFHQNLWNSLTNLCRHIIPHTKEAFLLFGDGAEG